MITHRVPSVLAAFFRNVQPILLENQMISLVCKMSCAIQFKIFKYTFEQSDIILSKTFEVYVLALVVLSLFLLF